jgi:starch synthase
MAPLKICLVASEVVPFAKTGGLADVTGALGKYLSLKGHDVRVFMPYYSTVDTRSLDVQVVDFIKNVPVQFSGFTLYFTALTARLPDSNCEVYFIHCEGLYNRDKIYTDHSDEYLRFALLSRAVIECCQRMGWGPDIFHCNDWQTALVPVYIKSIYNWDNIFNHSKFVYTIHNIGHAYQGVFSADFVDALMLGAHRDMLPREDLAAGVINYMKLGIIYADIITTVSPTYAREIQTPEYGGGLHDMLAYRKYRLVGILNGVDYQEWSPETDPYIPHHYSAEDLSGKKKNKKALLERMNLPYDPGAPVFGLISRLTEQKGFELLYEVLHHVLTNYNLCFVVLGSGEDKYTHFFQSALQQRTGALDRSRLRCLCNAFPV